MSNKDSKYENRVQEEGCWHYEIELQASCFGLLTYGFEVLRVDCRFCNSFVIMEVQC